MVLAICQNCGSILKSALKSCHSCKAFVSPFSSTALPNSNEATKALALEMPANQAVLEKVLLDQPNYLSKMPASNHLHDFGHLLNRANGDDNRPTDGWFEEAPKTEEINGQNNLSVSADNGSVKTNGDSHLESPLESNQSYVYRAAESPADIPAQSQNPAVETSKKESSLDFFAAAPPLVAEAKNLSTSSMAPSPNPFAAMQAALGKNEKETINSEIASDKISQPEISHSELQQTTESPAEKSPEELEKDSFKDEVEAPPPRRSFSGHKNPSQTKDNANDSHDEDDEPIPVKKKSTNGDLEIFGLTLSPVKATAIACAICLILWIGFQIFCSVGSTLFGALGEKMGGRSTQVSGMWRFAAQVNKSMCRGVMLMHQRNNQIFGTGKDNVAGTFRFNGTLKGNEIDFLKQYSRGGQDINKPIAFHGEIEANSNPPFAKGDFQTTYRQGYSWRAQIVNITGPWEAELVKPMAEESIGGYQQGNAVIKQSPNGGTAGIAQKGLLVAGVLLALVIGGWFTFIRIFGPDGWRSQQNKAKYIPSQFKRDHNRELKELSQPERAGSLPLGQRMEWRIWLPWEKKVLAIPPELRADNPHVLFLGGSGKGKTRLMAKMITSDIESGDRALVIVDSDGSLSELILRWMASEPQGKEYAKRVMIIDPTHRGTSTLSYNPLRMPDDGDLPNAAAAIEYGFKAIYTEPPGSQSQWTPQTAQILRSAALLLMINNRSLADLPNLLQDNDFRDVLLEQAEKRRKEKAEYGPLLDSWSNYKKMARTEQWINWVEPILNRVQRTLSDPRVRPVLTSNAEGINLQQIITEKKILIVNIPKGELHENGNLLGSLIVTGLKQAALSLAVKSHSDSRPVSLYLDEFDHFIEKETFNAITSETKVFQIGLLGATKTLQDFPEDFRNQLVIKFGTIAVFALAKKDGDMLGPQMFRVDGRKRKHETLTNFINPINTSPQFEFVSDEEKLNIDKVLGQPQKVFFCYRVGSVAGLFHLKSHPFNDVADKDVRVKLLEKMRSGSSSKPDSAQA